MIKTEICSPNKTVCQCTGRIISYQIKWNWTICTFLCYDLVDETKMFILWPPILFLWIQKLHNWNRNAINHILSFCVEVTIFDFKYDDLLVVVVWVVCHTHHIYRVYIVFLQFDMLQMVDYLFTFLFVAVEAVVGFYCFFFLYFLLLLIQFFFCDCDNVIFGRRIIHVRGKKSEKDELNIYARKIQMKFSCWWCVRFNSTLLFRIGFHANPKKERRHKIKYE